MKANHEKELEDAKSLYKTEIEQVQAAIDEAEIKKVRSEAEVGFC